MEKNILDRKSSPGTWVYPLLFVAVGCTLRALFIFKFNPAEFFIASDMATQFERTRYVLAGKLQDGMELHPLGYTLWLTIGDWLGHPVTFGKWSNWLFSSAAMVIGWSACRRALGERVALACLAVFAVHVPFVALAGFYLTESFFTLFLAVLFWMLVRWPCPWTGARAFAIGACVGFGQWVKGTNVFFLPILLLLEAIVSYPQARKAGYLRWLKPFAWAFAGMAIPSVLYGAMMKALFGRYLPGSPLGGFKLMEGKCPYSLNHDSQGFEWASPLDYQLHLTGQPFVEKFWDHPASDQLYYAEAALRCVRDAPGVLLSSFRYVYYLFLGNDLWPMQDSPYWDWSRRYGMLFQAIAFPMIVVGIRAFAKDAALRRQWRAFVPCLSVVVCSWFFGSEIRYRVPFDLYFLPLACIGARNFFGDRRAPLVAWLLIVACVTVFSLLRIQI